MTGSADPLRDALRRLADDVTDADLSGAVLRRSRRMAQQRAAASTLSALTALGLVCGGLWYLAPPGGQGSAGAHSTAVRRPGSQVPLPVAGRTGSPSADPRPAAVGHRPPPRAPQPAGTIPAPPLSRSLTDLPGQVFYDDPGGQPRVVRLTGGGTHTVLSAPHSVIGVSPDGRRIAYVQDGALLVAGTTGGTPQRAYAGLVSDAQAPAWSPDGSRLLVDADEPAVLTVADGTLTTLPGEPAGAQFRWSGDGSTLVYATTSCRLKVAVFGSPAVTVPVLGDPDATENPSGLGACRPVSVDATGSRVTVPLSPDTGPGAGGSGAANAVIDTATGRADPLPVAGSVIGAVFDADGDLLVRAADAGATTLSLFAPDGTLLVQAPEPSRLRGLDLVAYTY